MTDDETPTTAPLRWGVCEEAVPADAVLSDATENDVLCEDCWDHRRWMARMSSY